MFELPSFAASTDYLFTGQRDLASLRIYDYQARFYDPALGRFLQPDSIIPDPYNPISWDRYAYVQNSPTNFNDPTGHDVGCAGRDAPECASKTTIIIALGVDDGSCGYNSETMSPAYKYAVDHNKQVYFYDPDNDKYNEKRQKYDMAQDMSAKIKSNPANDFYLVGYSAGADSIILAAEMSEYSSNIKGGGVIDPYLNYADLNEKTQELKSQAERVSITSPLALADSPLDKTIVSINGSVLPDKNTQTLINTYNHEVMGKAKSFLTSFSTQ